MNRCRQCQKPWPLLITDLGTLTTAAAASQAEPSQNGAPRGFERAEDERIRERDRTGDLSAHGLGDAPTRADNLLDYGSEAALLAAYRERLEASEDLRQQQQAASLRLEDTVRSRELINQRLLSVPEGHLDLASVARRAQLQALARSSNLGQESSLSTIQQPFSRLVHPSTRDLQLRLHDTRLELDRILHENEVLTRSLLQQRSERRLDLGIAGLGRTESYRDRARSLLDRVEASAAVASLDHDGLRGESYARRQQQDTRQSLKRSPQEEVGASAKRPRSAAQESVEHCQSSHRLTMSLPTDVDQLSNYQNAVRQSLEYFVSSDEDVRVTVQGRKNSIQKGQVGIRCIHCADVPIKWRGKGSVYYPRKLNRVYKAAQNIAATHLMGSCVSIPDTLRATLEAKRRTQSRVAASGGKAYWVESCHRVGLEEREQGGICFATESGG